MVKICNKCGKHERKKHSTKCRKCLALDKKAKRKTKQGVISSIYEGEIGSSKARSHGTPTYSKEWLSQWLIFNPLFHKLYDAWVLSGYDKNMKPSVNRKDNNIGYTEYNIELMTWGENDCLGSEYHKNNIIVYDQKPVKQYLKNGEYIATYHSQAEAARVTGAQQQNISKVCKNQYGRNTAGGFKWEYA